MPIPVRDNDEESLLEDDSDAGVELTAPPEPPGVEAALAKLPDVEDDEEVIEGFAEPPRRPACQSPRRARRAFTGPRHATRAGGSRCACVAMVRRARAFPVWPRSLTHSSKTFSFADDSGNNTRAKKLPRSVGGGWERARWSGR